jgi:hypothetical protein
VRRVPRGASEQSPPQNVLPEGASSRSDDFAATDIRRALAWKQPSLNLGSISTKLRVRQCLEGLPNPTCLLRYIL